MNLPSSRRARILPPAPPPRPPAAGPAPPQLKADPDSNCPRCHTILTDPYGIGLCPRCGYCRSLSVEGVAVLAATGKVRQWPIALPGLQHAARVAPAAIFAIAVAFLAVVPLAYLADQRFPIGSRARAIWSTGSLACGAILLLAGQAWAVALLKRMKERVNWGDLLSPLQLWGMTLRRLPATAWPVGLGGSGILAVLAAVLWVGGLSYWFRLYPEADGETANGRSVAAKRHDGRDTQEMDRVARVLGIHRASDDQPAESAPEAPLASGSAPTNFASARPIPGGNAAALSDSRPTERCVIVGFVPGGDGREAGLVLATLRQGQLTFAGVVRNGLDRKPELLDRLSKLGRTRPPVEGLTLNAVWVRPEVFCEVHQSGANDKGELVDPSLKGLIED
jgi:hypothetical protein